MHEPFIIGTHNARDMLSAGFQTLRKGGTALDAVEKATRLVELNPDDTTVGKGGIPNLLGVQEMDASIMDGLTHRSGAVGAVKGFKHPISIARAVMEHSPHVLLVGEGAELFAERMGLEKADLSTKRSGEVYRLFIEEALDSLPDDYPYKAFIMDYVTSGGLKEWYNKLGDIHHGTVNIIAVDARGSIASAVSTSGTALKLPGRLGDSPIIGAGNYCDNRFGAAACTGRGELAIRLSTARTIVSYMENGKGLREACKRAMKDVNDLETNGIMNCLATDIEGNTMSATTSQGRESIHYYMNADTEIPEKRIGITVKPVGD